MTLTNRKKIPLRKCIVTGDMKEKKQLIRVVRSKDGVVSIDPTGKLNGRGAYLSINKDVILTAKEKNLLSSVFKVKVNLEIYDELIQFVEKEVR